MSYNHSQNSQKRGLLNDLNKQTKKSSGQKTIIKQPTFFFNLK